MKIYLSGPMTGLPDFNYPAFHAAAAALRDEGHIVYSPAEFLKPGETFEPRRAFAMFSAFICLEADLVVVLPGWEKSNGATTECALASVCDVPVVEWER